MAQEDLITDASLVAVLDAAAKAREQSLAILNLIEEFHARDHANPSSSPSDEAHLEQQLAASKQQKVLHAHLAQLRGLNKKAILSTRTTKQETSEARQEIDSLHLQLQNLYYEQRHLRGEIAGCEGYEHRYRTLPMIDTAEFLAAHPEHADANEHDLTIARIQDEHKARLELEEQRLALVKRKEALERETKGKKDELSRLDADVEKWLGGQDNVRRTFEGREKKLAAQREKEGGQTTRA
ncbi:hypothetical protein KC367_g4467 [Hortaea werneckii]|nr:hypothetical protein KC367_g4467 [Hortaea werneckii]